jgi:hypothetical protein
MGKLLSPQPSSGNAPPPLAVDSSIIGDLSSKVGKQALTAALNHAGSLLGGGFAEDCFDFLQVNRLMDQAAKSPKFTAKVERAVETALRKGLDHKAVYLMAHFSIEKSLMTSEKFQNAAEKGALLKASQGYFEYAAHNLVLTGQDPNSFFAAQKSAKFIVSGLLALGRSEKVGLTGIVKTVNQYNIPKELIQTPDFQDHALKLVERRVSQIRGFYSNAATRMVGTMEFIEAANLRERLPNDPNSELLKDITHIIHRLERDGYANKAEPIREFFNIAA